MSDENNDYIKISQLEETETPSPDAMFMISEHTVNDGYISKRMAMGNLSSSIYEKVKTDIQQAAVSLSSVDKASVLEDITSASKPQSIVLASAAKEMYTALQGGSQSGTDYLSKSIVSRQVVTGPVYFPSGLSVDTVTDMENNPKSVVNCQMLKNSLGGGSYPFIHGYGYEKNAQYTFTGDGSTKEFLVGVEKPCTMNVMIYSTGAVNLGIAIFCSSCVPFTTFESLIESARKEVNSNTSVWHPLYHVKLSNAQIHTMFIPVEKDSVILFYNLKTAPTGIEETNLFDGVKSAFPKNFKIIANQYRTPPSADEE